RATDVERPCARRKGRRIHALGHASGRVIQRAARTIGPRQHFIGAAVMEEQVLVEELVGLVWIHPAGVRYRRFGRFMERMLVPRVMKLPPTITRRTGRPVFGSCVSAGSLIFCSTSKRRGF